MKTENQIKKKLDEITAKTFPSLEYESWKDCLEWVLK